MRAVHPACLALAATAVGCARGGDHRLSGTTLADRAQGIAQTEWIEGDMVLVTVELDHLPPPATLGDGLTTYVAWAVTREGVTKSRSFDYDARRRTGRAWLATPWSRFELRITAEPDAGAHTPGNEVVVRQAIRHE